MSARVELANIYLYHAFQHVQTVCYSYSMAFPYDEQLLRTMEDRAGISKTECFDWRYELWLQYMSGRMDLFYGVMGEALEWMMCCKADMVCDCLAKYKVITAKYDIVRPILRKVKSHEQVCQVPTQS